MDGGGGSSSGPVSWPVQTLLHSSSSGVCRWLRARPVGRCKPTRKTCSPQEPSPISRGALGTPSSFSRLCLHLSCEATFLRRGHSGPGAQCVQEPLLPRAPQELPQQPAPIGGAQQGSSQQNSHRPGPIPIAHSEGGRTPPSRLWQTPASGGQMGCGRGAPPPPSRPSPPPPSAGPSCQQNQLGQQLPLPLGSIMQLAVFVQESFTKLPQTVDGWRQIQKEKTQKLSPSEQELAVRCEVVSSPDAWLIQGSAQRFWESVNPRGVCECSGRRGGPVATGHVATNADRCASQAQGRGTCARLTCVLVPCVLWMHCACAWTACVCGAQGYVCSCKMLFGGLRMRVTCYCPGTGRSEESRQTRSEPRQRTRRPGMFPLGACSVHFVHHQGLSHAHRLFFT